MAAKWIKVSAIYFIIGIVMGIYMSMSYDFLLRGTHAHINLLGWVSMAIFGLIYFVYPTAGKSKLATAQFWLHNIGLLIMMIALSFVVYGNASFGPIVGVGAIILAVSAILFLVNVFQHLKD